MIMMMMIASDVREGGREKRERKRPRDTIYLTLPTLDLLLKKKTRI